MKTLTQKEVDRQARLLGISVEDYLLHLDMNSPMRVVMSKSPCATCQHLRSLVTQAGQAAYGRCAAQEKMVVVETITACSIYRRQRPGERWAKDLNDPNFMIKSE